MISDFLAKKKLVDSIIDSNNLLNFLTHQFHLFSKNVRTYYDRLKPDDHKYLFNIFDKRLNKVRIDAFSSIL